MVQKSKILGKPALIFITVGTTPFQFNRLFSAVDKTLEQLPTKPKLVVQSENLSYQWQYRNIINKSCFSPNELVNTIKTADKIIAHAGPATLYLIYRYSKILPLIIGRSSIFKEHASNHQSQFANYIMHRHPKKLAKYFISQQHNLRIHIKNYLLDNNVYNKISRLIFNLDKKRSIMKNLELFITKK
jgi:UDP-N-acetylglucosamine transferase subunit ALG13